MAQTINYPPGPSHPNHKESDPKRIKTTFDIKIALNQSILHCFHQPEKHIKKQIVKTGEEHHKVINENNFIIK